MAHFAEIDEKGIVLRVIVAEQDFIDYGAVGDPKNWIQGPENCIGIGCKYDKVKGIFISPKSKEICFLK